MVAVHAGTDTYGKVKKVGPTAVVTKFAMVSAVPIQPEESYYYAGPGESTYQGVPFVFSLQTTRIRGMPLARIDRLSVVMAYVRALCGIMMVFGSASIAFVVSPPVGRALNNDSLIMKYALVFLFCAGSVGGLLTYCLPFQVSRREREIRMACGALLGMCVDPALVRKDAAQAILAALAAYADSGSSSDGDSAREPDVRSILLAKLAHVRATIALGQEREPLERRTDEILAQIERSARAEA